MNRFRRAFIALLLVAIPATTVFAQNISKKDKVKLLIEQAEQAGDSMNMRKVANAYAQAIAICREINDTTQLYNLLMDYTRALCYNGDYHPAIEVLIEVCNATSNHNQKIHARALMQLGLVNFFLQNWDDALNYYQRSREIALQIGEKQGVSIAENNIANIFQKKEDYSTAIQHYNASLKIQEEVHDTSTICNTYFNLATCYSELNNLIEAERLFFKAYSIANNIAEVEIMSLSLLNIGNISAKKGLFNEGISYMAQAERLAKKHGYRQVLNEIYRLKSEALENNQNYAEALNYYKKYKTFSDSTLNEKSISMLKEFQIQYETLEKDHQIELQHATIKRQSVLRITLMVGLILSLVTLTLLVLFFRLQRIRNRELEEINSTKDKLFSIISHDLKNPVIAQRNILQLLIENFSTITPELLKEQGKQLLNSTEMQLDLLHNLLNWSLIELKRMPYNPINFDLNSTVKETIKLLQPVAQNKNITIDIKAPANAIAHADKNMIAISIRNLLSNAIKFSYNGGSIIIDVAEANDYFLITISDNGVGMSKEQVDNLMKTGSKKSTAGTNGEIGSNLGLFICKDMVEINSGTFFVQSEEGKGTSFSFTVNKRAN